jgi:hypothetical protein
MNQIEKKNKLKDCPENLKEKNKKKRKRSHMPNW